MCWDSIWALVLIPAAVFPIQLLGRGMERSLGQPKALEPYSFGEELKETLGTWLEAGAASAIAADWGANQRIHLPLDVSSSWYI